ncbi:MAG: hypothetical protein ACXACO_13835 [Promethearchaeota archaeon]
MVYFEFNKLGFNCGKSKSKCSKYPKQCMSCLKQKLKELGFELDSNLEVYELDSYERHLQVEREIIWQKFLDVLNIRQILIMDKESGLKWISYSISGAKIDADLLSGFIQANITFAKSENASSINSKYVKNHQFYEFQYQNFDILLKDGDLIRLCLILDQKASETMKSDVLQLIIEFEELFHSKILNLKQTGLFKPKNMIDYLIETLNIKLVFPLSFARNIPPKDLEKIDQNQIQKAVVNLAKELLKKKQFFFVNNLLNRVKKIVNLDANIILYEIYQLVENNIFIPTTIEKVASSMELIQEATTEKVTKYKPISSILTSTAEIEELEMEDLDKGSVLKLLKNLIKDGKKAEKTLAYQIAEKSYKKALFMSKKYNLKEDINNVSQMLLNLENKEKQLELDFVLEAGENAEKNGDYINSINYYQKALKILESFLIFNVTDSRIKKLKRKIIKMRAEI